MMKLQEHIEEFLQKNQIVMHKPELAVQALTHPSCAQDEVCDNGNNQRLEFLGDAVLDMVIGEYLYNHYPDFKEGVLTQVRAGLVCENALYEIACHLDLGNYVLLGHGEENSGGRFRRSTLADATEALMGAIYLDSGLEATRAFILREMGTHLENLSKDSFADYKSRLQEWAQGHGKEGVIYILLDTQGPAHDRWFVTGVSYQGKQLATGSGKTKKESEQQAAAKALLQLQRQGQKV